MIRFRLLLQAERQAKLLLNKRGRTRTRGCRTSSREGRKESHQIEVQGSLPLRQRRSSRPRTQMSAYVSKRNERQPGPRIPPNPRVVPLNEFRERYAAASSCENKREDPAM